MYLFSYSYEGAFCIQLFDPLKNIGYFIGAAEVILMSVFKNKTSTPKLLDSFCYYTSMIEYKIDLLVLPFRRKGLLRYNRLHSIVNV